MGKINEINIWSFFSALNCAYTPKRIERFTVRNNKITLMKKYKTKFLWCTACAHYIYRSVLSLTLWNIYIYMYIDSNSLNFAIWWKNSEDIQIGCVLLSPHDKSVRRRRSHSDRYLLLPRSIHDQLHVRRSITSKFLIFLKFIISNYLIIYLYWFKSFVYWFIWTLKVRKR